MTSENFGIVKLLGFQISHVYVILANLIFANLMQQAKFHIPSKKKSKVSPKQSANVAPNKSVNFVQLI